MSGKGGGLLAAVALAGATGTGVAAADSWDTRLTRQFSGRWNAVQRDLADLEPRLAALPAIPIDDQGGTGGIALNHSRATISPTAPLAVEIRWKTASAIDAVALIPARRYDAKGLDPQYGMPPAFEVELLPADGGAPRKIAHEDAATLNPVRRGHPYFYALPAAQEAVGMRISVQALDPAYETEGNITFALAEAMAFQGDRNVAAGAEVRHLGGAPLPSPWHWSAAFLVDGQTPLGLPEIPASEHGDIGWMSEAHPQANQAVSLNVDLGAKAPVDAVRLVPAKRPTSDLPSGFGFPRKLVVSVSPDERPGRWKTVAEREFQNPGHNPVVVPFPATEARHVKVEATQLWKAFDSFPAFFALSELEVLSGEANLARGKGIHSPDGMMNLISPGGRFWSTVALSDGFGPDGRLVPAREWISRLDERLRLETRRRQLAEESAEIVGHWRHATQLALAVLAFGGVCLIIVLPIRYRLHSRREVVKVRERIAGDLHDEVGSNLGSIQMFADLAEGRSGPSAELKRIQRIAAETVSAVRDIVWLLRPTGDHRIGTVEHLRETTSIMLESLDWKFTADERSWQVVFAEETNRDLFLYFREALHNIMRHAKATAAEVRAETHEGRFSLAISDNGVGIEPAKLERPSTLRALRQRADALAAELRVESAPGDGTRLFLSVPLAPPKKRRS